MTFKEELYNNFVQDFSIVLRQKITDLETKIDESKFIENKYIVVKRGKKKYYLGEFN